MKRKERKKGKKGGKKEAKRGKKGKRKRKERALARFLQWTINIPMFSKRLEKATT